jgi:hypothetical protein
MRHRMGCSPSFVPYQSNMRLQPILHTGSRFIPIKRVSSSAPRKDSWSLDAGQREPFWQSQLTICSLGCQTCGLLTAMTECIGTFACTMKEHGILGIEGRGSDGSMLLAICFRDLDIPKGPAQEHGQKRGPSKFLNLTLCLRPARNPRGTTRRSTENGSVGYDPL